MSIPRARDASLTEPMKTFRTRDIKAAVKQKLAHKKSPQSLRLPKWKQRFLESTLFSGWTVSMVFSGIEDVLVANQSGVQDQSIPILCPRFRRDDLLPQLRRHWKKRHWSSGYCYYIAEVAKIMLFNACPDKQFTLKSNEEKKAKLTGLPHEDDLNKHFFLHYDNVCFDPERGPAEGQNPNARRASFRSHPSINATLLLAYCVEHLEGKYPDIALSKLRPTLMARVSQWKPDGSKINLKNEIRRLAGLVPPDC